MHDLLEGFAKLRIEYRVYDWIDKAVDVAQPSGEYEDIYAWPPVDIEYREDGIRDIAGKEWHPAN